MATPGITLEPRLSPDISVIVVTYNRAEMLANALESLINQKTGDQLSFEIVVVDDGSTDNTATVALRIAQDYPRLSVRYVLKEHGGEGDSRNKGVKLAEGQWIAFFDDDQLADPGWLRELYRVALMAGADCVDGSVCLDLPDGCDLRFGWVARRFLGEKFLSHETGKYSSKDTMGAGNVLIRRAVFDRVGGFDPTFRQGVDTDFFWRVARAGFKMYYSPQALVHHVIPHYRLRLPYLKETSLRTGVSAARIRLKYMGAAPLALLIFLRIGVALGRDLPLILTAKFLKKPAMALDFCCRIWFKEGFIRGGLYHLFPKLFKQTKFINSLDFYYSVGDIFS
jgi:glycosyltransferase involved in cell wall biosynthesis